MAKVTVKDPAKEKPYDGWMVGLGVAVLVSLIVYVAMHVGTALSGVNQSVPAHPINIVAQLFRGKLVWPRGATIVAVLTIIALIALVVAYRKWKKRGTKGRLGIDTKGDFMATGGEISTLTAAGVKAKAEDLGVRMAFDDPPGVKIGYSVADNVPVYGSYEDLHLDIWGPRQGKSTSRVIPAILDAIGPVIVTSNKRDVVDATRDVREGKGHPVYIFDPQRVALDPHDQVPFCWNPIAWVRGGGDLQMALPDMEVRSVQLAGHFADSDDGSAAKQDPFFDPEGEDLLAGLFLAAAVSERPITQVWDWVTNQQNDEPVTILRSFNQLYPPASGLASQYNADERTRSGVFGTAKKMARSLKLTSAQPWVVPGWGAARDFDELQFIEEGGTLYCLSVEGRGSAAPLVSALTAAVIDVATRKASQSKGGRLPVPLLAVLDEAANVVRWKDLPKQYSHFGSRGIVVMTVLQSWAQGERCWGESGMKALWAAANIRVLGSGVDDTAFLRERSEAIGDNDSISKSVSKSGGGKSYSMSLSSGRTFSIRDLMSMPRSRVVVFPSGGLPLLVRTEAWWEGPYKEQVERSIARHDPQHTTTFEDLNAERVSNAQTSDAPPAQEVQPL